MQAPHVGAGCPGPRGLGVPPPGPAPSCPARLRGAHLPGAHAPCTRRRTAYSERLGGRGGSGGGRVGRGLPAPGELLAPGVQGGHGCAEQARGESLPASRRAAGGRQPHCAAWTEARVLQMLTPPAASSRAAAHGHTRHSLSPGPAQRLRELGSGEPGVSEEQGSRPPAYKHSATSLLFFLTFQSRFAQPGMLEPGQGQGSASSPRGRTTCRGSRRSF